MKTIEKEKTCKDEVRRHYLSRLGDLKKLWALDCDGSDDGDPYLGNIFEYGLSFDYVAPGTFPDQRKGYFRYQISWGGPSEEFRIYTNPDFSPYRAEFWFLDWFDGAKIILSGKNREWFFDFFNSFFVEIETAKAQYEKAMEGN